VILTNDGEPEYPGRRSARPTHPRGLNFGERSSPGSDDTRCTPSTPSPAPGPPLPPRTAPEFLTVVRPRPPGSSIRGPSERREAPIEFDCGQRVGQSWQQSPSFSPRRWSSPLEHSQAGGERETGSVSRRFRGTVPGRLYGGGRLRPRRARRGQLGRWNHCLTARGWPGRRDPAHACSNRITAPIEPCGRPGLSPWPCRRKKESINLLSPNLNPVPSLPCLLLL